MCLYFPMALTHGPLVPTPSEPDVTSGKDKHKAMVREKKPSDRRSDARK